MDLLAKLEILAVTANNEDNGIILETASNDQFYNYTTQPPTTPTPRDKNSTFLVKLEGPLSTPSQVQELSKSLTILILKEGVGETSTANFCLITGAMKLNIVSALAESTFSATFVRINLSPKDLYAHSIAPTLGSDIDPTLPQNRATDAGEVFLPKQGEYPVW
ncbi:hypothetical protein AtubIFM56815_005019 [Aspergillus tubingensis]|uniref:Uncharacterized protein n=1 Tax=Aspergillus tubingensis TaxID=5068 RepID=A0A8H3XZV2_ASPTU|nr:AIG2 family protein [Aspergillus tubingensis]GFN16987.1 AIG2 family protein [Aspergillus tubingensis]GLA81371.1 hypothetical protein AtubIFM56815_005019 [Aspergillus tubingensis]GLB17523.1 hypothetical protein AtubIFM61612_007397 [Aspergillus tubingensis]